jgi:hypothetical protein
MMSTYLFGWVDWPFPIGCLIAGAVIGAVEYHYLQKDREHDKRR